MNFREAAGRELNRLDTGIEIAFSNFLFVDKEYASNSVLRRIFSLARKHDFKSILIEEILENDSALLVEENSALALRKPEFERSVVHRVSFFRCDSRATPNPSDFIGYVAFKRDFFRGEAQPSAHVYECVIPPFRNVTQNNFINGFRKIPIRTGLGSFEATGILYAQQNDLTFVCAHVALRTILSTILPAGDISYAEMNRIAGIDHTTKKLGTGIGGLSPDQMRQILTAKNVPFQELVHEPSAAILLPTEFQRELYGFIESGTPALLGFELDASPGAPGSRHVIPVFGHTFNEDTWLPQAHRSYFGSKLSYYPSENWLSTFVVHDDNFGPYLCLPRHFLQQEKVRILFGAKPVATKSSAVEAETVAFSYIVGLVQRVPKIGQDWYDRLAVFTLQGWLIIRAVLVSKGDYLKHLEDATGWQGERVGAAVIEKLKGVLPEFFWMAELSAPELFASSRRKFGEVLLVSDREVPKPLDTSIFLAARLPSRLIFREGETIGFMNSDLIGHSPLFAQRRLI